MKPKDYKCTNCNHVEELWVEDTTQFPDKIICSKCGSNSNKKFSIAGTIIHQGKCGNRKNGYASSPVSIKKS